MIASPSDADTRDDRRWIVAATAGGLTAVIVALVRNAKDSMEDTHGTGMIGVRTHLSLGACFRMTLPAGGFSSPRGAARA